MFGLIKKLFRAAAAPEWRAKHCFLKNSYALETCDRYTGEWTTVKRIDCRPPEWWGLSRKSQWMLIEKPEIETVPEVDARRELVALAEKQPRELRHCRIVHFKSTLLLAGLMDFVPAQNWNVVWRDGRWRD